MVSLKTIAELLAAASVRTLTPASVPVIRIAPQSRALKKRFIFRIFFLTCYDLTERHPKCSAVFLYHYIEKAYLRQFCALFFLFRVQLLSFMI